MFAAPLFAFSVNEQLIKGSLLAFVLFCSVSSSFYLINDVADVESARQHPVKCQRPTVAGLRSIPIPITMALVFLTSALCMNWLRSPALGATITTYAVLQVAYNL